MARDLPKDLKRLDARFAKPVYPGDVLTTSIAKGAFETRNAAGEIVLATGRFA